MRLGVNVIAYATGRELHDKLENTAPAKADVPIVKIPRSRLSIARLQHTGGWDTASGALRHLQLALAAKGFETAAAPTLSATDPALFDHPLLYMHGRKNFSFTDAERDQLKKYLETGFLFADACCGSQQFDESFRKLIEQLYQQPLQRIPVDHELLKMPTGFDIRQVHRRILFTTPGQAASSEPVLGEPVLEGMSIDGRLVLVYSKYDLSCALERQATVNCAGYPTEDAAKIAVNIVLYALFQ